MSLASERSMPVIEILRTFDGWYRLPAMNAPAWLPDERSALEAARRIWPGTAFLVVPPSGDVADEAPSVGDITGPLTETEMRALHGDR